MRRHDLTKIDYDNDNDHDIQRTPLKSNPRDLTLGTLITFLTITINNINIYIATLE